MTIAKWFLVAAVLLTIAIAVPTDTRASGCPPNDPTCTLPGCFVSGVVAAPTIRGTAIVVLTNVSAGTAQVDATARLEWQGKERVFRRHLGTFDSATGASQGVPITSPEDLICQLLNEPAPGVGLTDDHGLTLGQIVGVPPKQFKINARSISGYNFNFVPLGFGDQSGIADVTIFVVK